MKKLMEAALSYAAEGYFVFPCKPRSKVPATEHGFKDATMDELTIRAWWSENPEYNIGIRTGAVNELVVVDEDEADALKTLGWYVPATPTVKTSRGHHFYLRHPGFTAGSKTELGKNVDVKGDGGFVLAPPSVHEDGTVYEWVIPLEDSTFADCPDWLLQALSRLYSRPRVDLSAKIEEGNRNSELTRIGGLCRRVGMDHGQLRSTLLTHNRDYCKPPLEDEEVEQIARSLARYEVEDERASSSSSPRKNNDDDSDDTLPMIRRFMDMTPPSGPRPYIVDGVLFKGFAGALYGDGGSAKSLLMMHLGQCVSHGEQWLGFDTIQTKVLYLDFELDEDEQSRRAYQVASGMGYDEPPEAFYYLSGAGYSAHSVFDHALNICNEQGIGMVIVDSLGYALEGDAEASRDVLRFFREVEGAFRRAGVSLFIVDHQSKHGNYQEKTMFGSVYKTNSIRSVFQVEPGEHDDGFINLTVRHKKINFGPKLDPFGIRVTFDTDKVEVEHRELDVTELVGESTLNAEDRTFMALADGPMYPANIADATGLELGTVKNALTKLRRKGQVQNTGSKDYRGSNEVRQVSSVSLGIGDDGSDTHDSQRTPLKVVS